MFWLLWFSLSKASTLSWVFSTYLPVEDRDDVLRYLDPLLQCVYLQPYVHEDGHLVIISQTVQLLSYPICPFHPPPAPPDSPMS